MTERIIVLLDMDCFYVQVEEREYPHIKGKPAAVVQYNTWKGGGIIAVNYEARSLGVERGMRGHEAKEKCPTIHLVQVPVQRGKADLTKYRNAGKEVVSVLCKFSDCVERASIDEAYIDFTKIVEEKLKLQENTVLAGDLPSTWVVGFDDRENDELPSQTVRHDGLSSWLNEKTDSCFEDEDENEEERSNILKLSTVAKICEEMRRKVLEETGFKCSAGISHNKMLSKLACGLHKPNQQTVLPMSSVPLLWSSLAIGKIRNLGGKLGDSITTDFKCKTMGDVAQLSIEKLRSKYDEKTASWLFSLGRGIENEVVISRQLPKSIGCGKNFNGKDILNSKQKVNTWMKSLTDELSERLFEDQNTNNRIAKSLSVHIRVDSKEKPITSRSCFLPSYKSEAIAKVALGLISSSNTASSKEDKWDPPIRNISLSASKFDNLIVEGTSKINDFFKKIEPLTSRTNKSKIDTSINESVENDDETDFLSDSKDDRKKDESKIEKNPQKSFFLQFLSQNSSEKVRKKFLADSTTNKKEKEEDNSNHPIESNEEHVDHSDDEVYDKSTDVDEDILEESETVEVIDISSQTSPVLKSKRSKSPSPELLGTQDSSEIPEPQRTQEPPNISESHLENFASTSIRSSSSGTDKPECVSVQEIFPDLDNVDWSVAVMLPPALREKVYEEVRKYKRLTSSDADKEHLKQHQKSSSASSIISRANNFSSSSTSIDQYTFCRECNRKILTHNFVEHSDYHFASELRKQQMTEARSSLGSTSRKRENHKNSPVISNRNKKQKNLMSTEIFTPKIENYFKKKE